MPEIPQLIPPADLLSQFGGIEQGLRRGRRLRIFSLLLAAIQATILAANSEWLKALASFDWSKIGDQLWLLIPLFVGIVALLFAGWTRVWLKESRAPFRYTFSVAPFEPMAGGTAEPRLALLRHDLLERISTRIPRLSRLDEPPGAEEGGPAAGGADASDDDDDEHISHIHISGAYAKRVRPPQPDALLEVTAWVRIGSKVAPSNLAHPVKFPLRARASSRPAATPGAAADGRPVTDQEYEEVLERIYFSVASEIYMRIQSDVRRKIRLLPRRYFRAVAYFHEADDYGRSNTLDAYDEAKRLYGDALRTYDPTWGTAWSPSSRAHPFRRIAHGMIFALQRTRRALSHVWHRLGRIEVLIARAHLGYANALLYRRILASQLGMSQNPIFEARPIAERAIKRLRQVSREVPGRDDSLFEAHVTLAFAFDQLGWASQAEQHLRLARSLDPARSDGDPRYLFAAALLEPHLLASLRTLRRTVELDDTFEAAQFELARRQQTLWESRDQFEKSIADTIASEYAAVLALNPGNIAAWSNRAHMRWLLGTDGDLTSAREDYESGRQYKEIARQAFVVSIDWGLARVAAEKGDFEAAYTHYIDAVSALVAQGRSFDQFRYTAQQVDPINGRTLKRFREYRDRVQNAFINARPDQLDRTTERVRKSVLAFVYNDYGWACQQYYNRTGDETKLADARTAYAHAKELNPNFVLAYYNLHFASLDLDAGEAAGDSEDWLYEVYKREPSWPEANLLMLTRWMRHANEADRRAIEHADRARDLRAEAAKHTRRAGIGPGQPTVRLAPRADGPAARLSMIREAAEARAPVAEVKRAGHSVPDKIDQAAQEERLASKRARERDELHDKARRLAPELLPQSWLWTHDGEFDWRIVTSRSRAIACRRNLLWERSFDDFHARALFQWGRGRQETSEDLAGLDAVFEVISRAFWPNDVDLLTEQRGLAAQLGRPTAGYDKKIHTVVRRWVEMDAHYWTLRWLTGDAFLSDEEGRREAARELDRAAKRNDLTPRLYKWLGDQLRTLADRLDDDDAWAPAAKAYVKAAETARATSEYALLLEVGELLEDVDGWEASEPWYESALESDHPPVLARAGRWFARHENWERACDAMHRALDNDPDPEDEPGYRRTYARSLWARGEYRAAIGELTKLDTGPTTLKGKWRAELAHELETQRATARMRLREWLTPRQREAATAHSVDETAQAVDAGRALLESSRSRRTAAWERPDDDEAGADAPVAVPVELAADARFFPEGEETPALKRVARQIDEMLKRIRAERGLCPSFVAIWRPEDVEERHYGVSLNDAPVESGRVPEGVDNACDYMLDRVEELVRRHLARFADSEMVDALLEEWAAGTVDSANDGLDESALRDRRELLVKALPDEDARRRFGQVVRELVREGVSVGRIDAILHVALDGALFDCVETAREALRDDLPVRGRRLIDMPASIEDVLVEWWGRNNCRSLTLPESVDRELAAQIAGAVNPPGNGNGSGHRADSIPERVALVVANRALRPFAARFVERHFPDIPVLAREERPVEANDHPGRLRAIAAKAVGR